MRKNYMFTEIPSLEKELYESKPLLKICLSWSGINLNAEDLIEEISQ